jgi:pyridoxal 5-phosphate dependent beta-lyase
MSVRGWVADRVATGIVHADVAGAGRVSQAVLDAQAAHLLREAEVGAYVAEAEADLAPGRAALGALVGLAGDDVFFAEGSSAAYDVLLRAWPLGAGARVGTVPGEYGGHALRLSAVARDRGWDVVPLPVDALGRVVEVPAGLDLVSLPLVPSHRGVRQPAEDVIGTGVRVLLDVAQGAGQTAVPAGAAAYTGTSRKWLCGPRGVGFGVVDPVWAEQLQEPATLRRHDTRGTRRFDSTESHAAGRVGLAVAARAWSPALVPVAQAAAAAARVLLAGAGGWEVVEPVEEPTGMLTLRHPSADPGATREALREEGLLTAVVPVHRAEELGAPLLRVSTAAWVTPGDLEALASALERRTAG